MIGTLFKRLTIDIQTIDFILPIRVNCSVLLSVKRHGQEMDMKLYEPCQSVGKNYRIFIFEYISLGNYIILGKLFKN